jgi:hypothetical protein
VRVGPAVVVVVCHQTRGVGSLVTTSRCVGARVLNLVGIGVGSELGLSVTVPVGDADGLHVVRAVVGLDVVGCIVVGDRVTMPLVGLGVSSSDVRGVSVVVVLSTFTLNGAGVIRTGLDVGSLDGAYDGSFGSRVPLSVTNGLVGSIVVGAEVGMSVPFGEIVGGA